MCGRYSLAVDLQSLQERFRFVRSPAELRPRYNIAPSQEAPIVVDEDFRALELYRWGLIPSWAKDTAMGHRLINARAESLADLPSFKESFRRRRCLVIADGFYEWAKAADAKTKVPMRIVLSDHRAFAMAGLWDAWQDGEGKEVRSFAIITTEAAPALRAIHDRMPVILDPGAEDPWLDPKTDPKELRRFLVPSRDEGLDAYEVSPLINSPADDLPAHAQRLGTGPHTEVKRTTDP